MNKEETRQRLIELGIAPEMVVGGVWDVRNADLTGADLRWADLRWADLRWANLSNADLTVADLRWADLSRADLSGAIMNWAILTGSYGSFTTGSFGRQTAIAAGGYISINSERHTYEYWLEHYEEILRFSGYNGDEIADYGAWIKQAVARQRRIEGKK